MFSNFTRINREKKTVKAMLKLYCRNFHGQNKELCGECSELFSYSFERLEKCSYEDNKPTCVDCPKNCYKLEKREKIREVMRYAGPRMLLYHPILAIFHIIDGKKNKQS
ncbi:nitrous oxide-stimulated promoter family protein [candidate division KSB1 bacterium]|nr:nitrous oxide-stimulated promoter family protein [candidate division KSB1 bacterium]